MGGSQPKPEPPQKTVKELVKEFTRTIGKMRREFGREIMKLEQNNKKIQRDLEAMAKRKEQRSTMRIIAQNILKNNQYITKYNRLDAQLGDVQFQLSSAATTETLVQVMKGMGDLMKKSNSQLDVKNIHMVMETFNMEMEKQNMMQEQIQEIMAQDEDEINDEEVDKLVIQAEMKVVGGPGGGGQQQVIQPQQQQKQENQSMDQLEERLKELKQ